MAVLDRDYTSVRIQTGGCIRQRLHLYSMYLHAPSIHTYLILHGEGQMLDLYLPPAVPREEDLSDAST